MPSGGLGGVTVPPHIFMLGNVPHDWLFDKGRVAAVVHHGGAGTTAIGLAKGCPTVVVPFFGDQGFWGNMIYNSGAGPKPIPHKELSVKKLQEAITYAISPEAKEAARHLAQKIHDEDGVKKGVESFYKHLPLLNMRCDLDPTRLAVWWSTEQCLKLSAFAAQTLADAKLISLRNLILHRPKDFKPRRKTCDPQYGSSGGANGLFWSLTNQSLIGISGVHIAAALFHTFGGLTIVFHERSTVGKAADEAAHGFKYEHWSKESETLIGGSPAKRQPSHSQPKLSPMTIPVQGSWKLVKTKNGQTVYNRERLTRIAEGRKAVKASTEEQRAKIIERFKEEISQTPIRKKMYQDAVDRQYGSSVATSSSSSTLDGSSLPDQPSTDDDGSGRGKKRPSNVHRPSSSISSILSVISPIENISPKKSFFGKKLVEPPLDVDAAAEAQAQVVTEKSPRSPLWKGNSLDAWVFRPPLLGP
ncbi:hypothetical protein D9613_003312 [Agrocybe pediades]|uniref:Erythromycin biosynthesis protein CIII-like C-terminal domain-containing protein n=1 Tax=Agrocybe pediades TaxID=84607 RepID=A0A8H4VNM4_9AGAR|nr:hypothetical protein D9613_003312 [Agrocybe pediades]